MGDENGKSYSLSPQVSTTNTDAASQSQLRTALLMNYGDTTGNNTVLFGNVSFVRDEVVVIAILQALLNSLTADSLESIHCT